MRNPIICFLVTCLVLPGCSKAEKPVAQAAAEQDANTAAESSAANQASATNTKATNIDAEALMSQVQEHFDAGDYRAAFPLLDQLHAAKACPAEGYAIRAQILDHSGLTSQAVSSLTLALTKQPENAKWHNMLGLLFVKMQNLPMARQAFTKAIELDPEFAKAYNNRGLISIGMKEYGQAINDFNLAIRHDKEYIDALNNRGYAYLEQGNYSKAIENFTDAIAFDESYVKSYNNRGFTHMKVGDNEAAVKDFSKAIELSPNVVKHYLHRRDAWLAMGDQEKAVADQKQAQWTQQLLLISRRMQREPKNAELLVERAKHFVAAERFEEAFEDLSQAEKMDQDLAAVHTCRAEIYYGREEYKAAIESCTKALDADHDFSALSLRGDAYMATGKLDEAIADYNAAQRFDGTVAMAYWKRAEERKEGGDKSGADADRKIALQLDPKLEETKTK
ncbi:tetratricopeptide repeat protein [Rubinisphaera sp. JC750]|uniref:tetratricopeptide repeat protein n=1 Tax=Rubinisphaera sp. JC750 TaxID=2898658 RepID=UPI001F3CED8C|nr:tetratricopeptide repeat protein [Rubinisphaera sp. JC750]